MSSPVVLPLTQAERYAPLAHHLIGALRSCFGEPAQPPWKEAPYPDQRSTRDALLAAITHPEAGPADEHERWAAAKRGAGWGYGKVRDDERRLHPLLVPYDALPPAQRVKDVLFVELGAAIREGRLP